LESSAWGLKESLGVKQWVSIEKQFFQKFETYGKHPKTKLLAKTDKLYWTRFLFSKANSP
jgi:hypothetical protein